LQLMQSGLPGYEALQEGLAVLAEYLVGGLSRPRLRLLAGRVIAAANLINGATFVDNFRSLNREWRFNQNTAFSVAFRIHRGGGLTKDAVYLHGLIELLKYLKNGGDLTPLFTGKIAISQISIVLELQYRQVLKPILLRPRYMENSKIDEKLRFLKVGLTPIDLIQKR
ncbi:MAG: tyrosine/phenylalanine carboxypeptidase domain-containing protein, partial [bacterium]